MKIGIDLDDVLADFLSAILEYHNLTYGTSFVREDFRAYGFWKTWGGTREEAIQKVYDFHKTPYFENIQPIWGSQEGVSILKQNHDLVVVTSRQDVIAGPTGEWISRYFPDVFSEIYFANHNSQNGSPTTKGQICDSVGVDVLIEDAMEYAVECLRPKRQILLFDRPWNRSPELPEGIFRVYSWKEILNSPVVS